MKRLIMILALLLLFTGCTNNSASIEEEKLEKYKNYYESITDNAAFTAISSFYDIQVVMNRLGDGTYRYDIIIDNPRIAMYDIEVIAVENDMLYSQSLLENKMMPTLGVFEDDTIEYNMIPNQVNLDSGYIRGISISGISTTAVIDLKIRVSWKDYTKVNTTREFIELTGDYFNQNQGPAIDPDAPENEGEEGEETDETNNSSNSGTGN